MEYPQTQMVAAKLGYAADPAIEMLLPKDKLAEIKVRKLDTQIQEMESVIGTLKMERELLIREYGFKM